MSNNPSPSGYCLYFNSCAQGLVKTHPIKHDTSFTYPKICINQTSPFWKQLRRCRHPPTTSNDPSPSGYCASTSTLALEDSRRHIQSNTILPSHTPKYASIKHRHFGSDCGAAAIHSQRQTIPHHQATMPPLLFSRKLLENSQRHIQSSASLPAHTSIKHCHFGSWAKSFDSTCAGPSGRVCLRLPPTFKPGGGTYDRRFDAITTQDQMDDRGIIPASGGIAHPTTGGIVAMMGGINPMPGCITPMTCCITPMTCCIIPIPNTGNIVFLLMMAVIVPKMGSRWIMFLEDTTYLAQSLGQKI